MVIEKYCYSYPNIMTAIEYAFNVKLKNKMPKAKPKGRVGPYTLGFFFFQLRPWSDLSSLDRLFSRTVGRLLPSLPPCIIFYP